MRKTNKTAKNILPIPSDRSEWLRMRRDYVGASEAPILMNGIHFKRTPLNLWEEKLGFCSGVKENIYMKRGRDLEETARQAYEKKTDSLVVEKIALHEKNRHMMSTLDGITPCKTLAVELKCPSSQADHETALSKKVPLKYFPQLQHQLACTGHEYMHYASYKNGEIVIVEVGRDNEYIEKLQASVSDFWESISSFTPPKYTDHDYETITSVEWKEKSDQHAKITAAIKKLKADQEKIKAWALVFCGKKNSRGFGLSLKKTFLKGPIDYSAIPELFGVDLDLYRGASKESWSMRGKRA